MRGRNGPVRKLLLSVAVLAAASLIEAPESENDVVSAWFERMNALDESEESVDALIALYQPDALHITGPESHQLGAVTYAGHENIRKMARDFVATYESPRFRVEVVTAREQSLSLFHRADGPWGGASVAVEYVAAYTRREDGTRTMAPGAAFFQLADGKIRRARFYFATGETAPVQ